MCGLYEKGQQALVLRQATRVFCALRHCVYILVARAAATFAFICTFSAAQLPFRFRGILQLQICLVPYKFAKVDNLRCIFKMSVS